MVCNNQWWLVNKANRELLSNVETFWVTAVLLFTEVLRIIHTCGSMSIPLFSMEQKGSSWFGLAHWGGGPTSGNKFRDSLFLLERWGTAFIIQHDCCIQQCLHTVAAVMVHHIVGLGGGGRRGVERRGFCQQTQVPGFHSTALVLLHYQKCAHCPITTPTGLL